MGDAHGTIVDGDGQLVGHHAIGPSHHEVVCLREEPPFACATEKVGEAFRNLLHADAPGRRFRHGRLLGVCQLSAVAIIDRKRFPFMRRAADAVKPRAGAVAGVDLSLFVPSIQDFLIQRKSLALQRLAIGVISRGPFVIGKPQPFQILFDGADVLLMATLPVDVLDAKDDVPALLLRPQPIQEGDPHISQVHISRRTRRESGTNFHRGPPMD